MVKKQQQIAPPWLCRWRGAGQIGQASCGVGRAGSAACSCLQLPAPRHSQGRAALPAAVVPGMLIASAAPGAALPLGVQAGTCPALGTARPFSLRVRGGSRMPEWLYLLNLSWPGQGVGSVASPFPASTASPAWLPGCACCWGLCFDANFDQNPIFSCLFPWVTSACGRGDLSDHLCPQLCHPPTSVVVSSSPIHWVRAARCNRVSIRMHRAGGQILRVLSTHGTRTALTRVCPGLPFQVDLG